MIVNDSIDQGMRLLGESFDQLLNSSSTSLQLDYKSVELISIIRDFGFYQLTGSEEKFRDLVVKGLLNKEPRIEEKFAKAIKKKNDSELLSRIRLLLFATEKGGNRLDGVLEDMLDRFPDHGFSNFLKGEVLQDDKSFKESLSYLTKSIEAYPILPRTYLVRGDSYYGLKNYELAIIDYSRAITLDDEYDWAHNRRGDAYYRLEKIELAISDYDRAIELNPENKYYWKDRGNCYLKVDDYSMAKKDFQRSVKLDENYDYAIKRLGDSYFYSGEYKESIEFYDKALEIDPEYKSALFRKGLAYGRLNLSRNAIKTYERIIKIDSRYSSAYGNIGWEYYRLGDFQKCIEFSELAIEHNDQATYAMFNKALATLRLDRVEQAKQLYRDYKDHCLNSGIEIK